MKRKLIVANWKSNKTENEAKNWFSEISNFETQELPDKEIVVCPSSIHLSLIKSFVDEQKLPIALGVQDVSVFNGGSYTGEINGKQLKEFADYVLIGHSERRTNFGETDEMLFEKVKLAKEAGLKTIYCVQGKETKIPENIEIIAYEPVNAIGTGNPDNPENADDVGAYFKTNFKVSSVLYGGSVTPANVGSFTGMSNIDGVLVGRASLDAKEFYEIIQNS